MDPTARLWGERILALALALALAGLRVVLVLVLVPVLAPVLAQLEPVVVLLHPGRAEQQESLSLAQ